MIANIDGIDRAGGVPLVALMMGSIPVGASLLAMDVNDDAGCLGKMRCIDDHREQARSYRDWLNTQIPTVSLMMQSSGGHGVVGGGFYTG